MPQQSTLDRFLSHVSKSDDPDGCWLWMGHRRYDGYGTFWFEGSCRLAHRMAYKLMVGDIDPKTVLHHLCETKHCVNPAHLQPTTNAEHIMKYTPGNLFHKKAAQTHCINGHPLTPDNLVAHRLKKGKRRCYICWRKANAAAGRRFNEKKKSKKAALHQTVTAMGPLK